MFDLPNHVKVAADTSANTLYLVISGERDVIQHVDQGYQFQTIWQLTWNEEYQTKATDQIRSNHIWMFQFAHNLKPVSVFIPNVTSSPIFCILVQSLILSVYNTLCLPCTIIPSIFLVSSCSKMSFFLTRCSMYDVSFFIASFSSFGCWFTFFNTSLLVFFSF